MLLLSPAVTVGAVLQLDDRTFVEGNAVDTFAFRSARLDLAATVDDTWDVRLVPDFAGGKLVLQDAYVDAHYSDEFRLRFGKLKVPFGLERLQEERNTQFTERGLPTQLAPNRDLGVEVFGELGGGLVSYQAGVFNGVADGGSGDIDVSDDKDLAVRVFVRPLAGHDIGFGGAATAGEQHGHLATNTDVGSFKTAGQTTFFQFAPATVADGLHWRATAQAYAYEGPFQLFGEYVRTQQHVLAGTRQELAKLDAWQLMTSFVITGEHASYNGVTPLHSYGAFDVAARIGKLRVIDQMTATSVGAGVDWYPNRTIRFMVDLDHTWFADRPNETSITCRAQAAF
jgi:phosphate-selective porin OprO/OprP